MITIERAPSTEAAFKEIADFGMAGLREYLVAPIDMEKAAAQLYVTLADKMMFVARDEVGEIVGCLGMMVTDLWYSRDAILLSKIGPFVRPDQRFGTVGVKLMRAVRGLADELDMLAFVWVTRPGRKRATDAALFAQVAGYVPLGHVLKIRGHRKQDERVAEPA